jgi:hypothetical protein
MNRVYDILALLNKYNYDGKEKYIQALYDETYYNKEAIIAKLGGLEKTITFNVASKIDDNSVNFEKSRGVISEIKDNHDVLGTPLHPIYTALKDVAYYNPQEVVNNAFSERILQYLAENTNKENIETYNGVKLNSQLYGMKLTKIIAKLFPNASAKWNDMREQLLKLTNKEYNLQLSVNPYHFFKMSTDNNFSSCYNIDEGCYHGGITNYIRDNVTVVSFLESQNTSDCMNYRQLIHVDMYNQTIIIARPYPEFKGDKYNEVLRDVLRKLFFSPSETTESDEDTENQNTWKYTNKERNIANRVYVPNRHTTYVDVLKGSYEGVSMTWRKTFDIEGYTMTIASERSLCIDCGSLYNDSESLSCCTSNRGTMCRNCEERHDEDNMYHVNGSWYCSDCTHDLFRYCDKCDEWHCHDESIDVYIRGGNTAVWCQSCTNDYAFFCGDCENWYSRNWYDEYSTENDDTICNSCYENHYFTCEYCDEVIENNYQSDNENECTCKACEQERENNEE